MLTWIEEEIQGYRPVENSILRSLYDRAEIPSEKPWARAEYLAEGVLRTTMTDTDLLMRIAAKKGRHSALHFLEEMVIANLKADQDPILDIVRRGCYAQVTLPNLEDNGYSNALYRIYGPIREIKTDRERKIFDKEIIPIPSEMEALRTDGTWKPFPCLTLHVGERKGIGYYYIFRADGKYNTMENLLERSDEKVLKEILPKTKGTTSLLERFEKREA